ncbi:hypothetical protein [Listeria monocytogenes]|nr:hypothetical protein [Listeria monocytogenes]
MTEYALYKADELLIIGTVDELAVFQKVKRETILFMLRQVIERGRLIRG